MEEIKTIAFAFVLLICNAFFVASEFSVISSRKDRLEQLIAAGKKPAKVVLRASEHLSESLAGAQFGITIASLLLGKVGEPAIAHMIARPAEAMHLPHELIHPLSFAIALGIVTMLHIIIGEMVPKNIALAGPETVAMQCIPTHQVFVRITRPVIVIMNHIAGFTLKLFGIEQRDGLDATVDQDQLATMITESRSEGLLDAQEHARLNKALSTASRLVTEVTIPQDKVRTLDFGATGPSLGALEAAVNKTGFSRFPVTSNGAYIGYVHVKDVLDRLLDDSAKLTDTIDRSQIRPLINVDSSGSVDETMRIMRRQSAHMAQVMKEGSTIGVVTLEDLIEEFVGTVRDWTHEPENQ